MSFAGRRWARRYALQGLYAWGLTQNSLNEIETFVLTQDPNHEVDLEYFQKLLYDIPKITGELDAVFQAHLSRPLEDLDWIELMILRMAVYELQYQPEVPYRVVLNEGVELAKRYGSQDSHKFVNGVIDKVVKQLNLI